MPVDITHPTPAALALDALARILAQRNPDAAAELARRLAYHVARQRAALPRLGIAIRVDVVTGRVEVEVR